jgi:hypothetical protein
MWSGLPAEKVRFAAVDGVDAGENLHQRRLARAVLPDQPEHLAGAHVETDLLQRLHTGKGFADVFHPQQCALLIHARRAPCRTFNRHRRCGWFSTPRNGFANNRLGLRNCASRQQMLKAL